MPTYYAERRTINEGAQPVTVTKYGTRRAMERQFHLFCANALDGDDFANDLDAIEWGTLENGSVERIVYVKEPTPETEPEGEGGEEPTEPIEPTEPTEGE